jgi:hypothetical protein
MQENPTADQSAQLDDYAAFEQARNSGNFSIEAEVPKETPSEAATADEESAEGTSETGQDSETGEQQQENTEEKKKAKGGFQKKIDKLTARNRDLEARLSRLEPAPAAAAPAEDKEPKIDDFEKWADYDQARIAHEAKKIAAAERAKETEAAQRKQAENRQVEIARAWTDQVTNVKAEIPDFTEVLEDCDETIVPTLGALLAESEHGARMLYDLAKSEGEIERLGGLNERQLAREFGRLEAKYLNSPAKSPETSRKVSSAPKPPATVGQSSRSSINAADSGDDYAAFEKRRTAELRKR